MVHQKYRLDWLLYFNLLVDFNEAKFIPNSNIISVTSLYQHLITTFNQYKLPTGVIQVCDRAKKVVKDLGELTKIYKSLFIATIDLKLWDQSYDAMILIPEKQT